MRAAWTMVVSSYVCRCWGLAFPNLDEFVCGGEIPRMPPPPLVLELFLLLLPLMLCLVSTNNVMFGSVVDGLFY